MSVMGLDPEQLIGLMTGAGLIAAPVFTYLGAHLTSRKARLEADAKLDLEKMALETKAEEAASAAAIATQEAITSHWSRLTESIQEDRKLLQKRVETLESRLQTNDERLNAADERARVFEDRAIRWESLYRIAVDHMRKLISWAADVSHMDSMPDPPAELIDVL